jgi:hypothetical protein
MLASIYRQERIPVTVQSGRQTKRQNDFTGRQAQEVAAKAAEDKRLRDEQVADAKAAEQQEFADSVFDVTNPDRPVIVDEVVEVGVEMANDTVIVRVAETIENMTVGHGNTYHFKAGGKYQVPREVAERLDELGLLWH